MCMDDVVVMSIAGFDPSGGAGVLADAKTFEAIGVKSVLVNTANTVQTDKSFFTCEWLSEALIMQQLEVLSDRFKVSVVKIGIIENLTLLEKVIVFIKEKAPRAKIIWDPILEASTGYCFHALETFPETVRKLLPFIDLTTPNAEEIRHFSAEKTVSGGIEALIPYTNILVKGGHRQAIGVDELYRTGRPKIVLPPGRNGCTEKHGSGCVLSAAITAYFHLTQNWEESCRNAKTYTEKFLASTPNLIGTHK